MYGPALIVEKVLSGGLSPQFYRQPIFRRAFIC